MTISYIEKGLFLHEEIARQGFTLIQKDGIFVSDNDVEVQNIIDTFDPLPPAKQQKRQDLKDEATNRSVSVYEFIKNVDPVSFFQFADDLFTSVKAAARDPLKPNLLALKGIRDAANTAIADINALGTLEEILTYDVVNTPIWPE